MALYAVYYQTGIQCHVHLSYQTGVSPLDGEPLCAVCLITQSEAAAIAKEQELTKAGLTAWYDQIQ